MATLAFPACLNKERANDLRKYLRRHGNLEELPVTNEYEYFRFQYEKGAMVLYRNKAGKFSVNCDDVRVCWEALVNHTRFPFKGSRKNRSKGAARNERRRTALLQRDGKACFYCRLDMPEDDQTLEHLLSLAHGGSNRIENMALAHDLCNQKAKNLSVVQKVQLRESMSRIGNAN